MFQKRCLTPGVTALTTTILTAAPTLLLILIKISMKDWLKLKNYLHFSPKFERNDKGFIRSYVKNKNKIDSHRFYPLIHFTIVDKKFKRRYDENGNREKLRKSSSKKREIYYANHLDAQVYAYHSRVLTLQLEEVYKSNALLNDSILAYRAIPINDKRNKCNIDFAFETFDIIKNTDKLDLTVLCFDIKGFFDTLDHSVLKDAWKKIRSESELPKNIYNIFRSITKFSFVQLSDILAQYPKYQVKKISYLKNKKISSFCECEDDFRKKIVEKGLIRRNRNKNNDLKKIGIPQGTPISATLSNLYMLSSDSYLSTFIDSHDGIYRRYSDDILVICPSEKSDIIERELKSQISQNLKLTIQDTKTQKITFQRKSQIDDWNITSIENGITKQGGSLSYLGFEFDGKNIRIRQKGLSKFYRDLKRLINRKARYASSNLSKKRRNPDLDIDTWIYRTRIYKNKTHLGAKRKKIHGKVFWGNYYSYVKTSSKLMNEPAIKKQLRNHWKIVESLIKFYEEKYDLSRSKKKK